MATIAITAWRDHQGSLTPHLVALLSRQMPHHKLIYLDALAQPQQRAAAINEASLLVVVIGREWSLVPPNVLISDLVGAEIVYAINRPYPKIIIPILSPGAVMPQAQSLPLSLQPFAYFQAIVLRDGAPLEIEVDRIRTEIQNLFRKQWQIVRDRGNYNWFKIISWASVVFFGLFALAGYLTGPHPDGGASLLLFLLALSDFLSILFLWIASFVIAIITSRPGWAIINGLSFPLVIVSIISAEFLLSLKQIPILEFTLAILIIVIIFTGLFVWPIIFGLNLPPYRRVR